MHDIEYTTVQYELSCEEFRAAAINANRKQCDKFIVLRKEKWENDFHGGRGRRALSSVCLRVKFTKTAEACIRHNTHDQRGFKLNRIEDIANRLYAARFDFYNSHK